MRDETLRKSKRPWSKAMVRKWFNIRSKSKGFHADDPGGTAKCDFDATQVTDTQDYRLFVSTWNVGGKSPPSYMNLEGWLHSSPPADIYVLGFQEIVPLNAGNVLGAEDNGPARRWVSLIRKTLNNLPGAGGYGSYHTPSPAANLIPEFDDDFGAKNSSFFHRHSFQALRRSRRMDDGDVVVPPPAVLDRRFSVCDRVIFGGRLSDFDANFRWGRSSDDENIGLESPTTVVFSPASYGYGAPTGLEGRERSSGRCRYSLIASKQMVGIFLTVWAGSETRDCVRNLKISCVGRGLMGYLGNKGSISISMSLHHTTFCFVCGHLTSGEKDGDELRRNADVMEILRKTRFPRVSHNKEGCEKSPETILEHDRIIWLGDLNYRIALSYRAAKALVEMQNWKVLLEKDQLRIEQRSGRVFTGWNEGTIYFPPTYKYSNNSDRYAVDDINPKEKRRTPAWCDRILWQGRGLHQLSYVRGESRFSDHRPVSSVFDVEVELMSRNRLSRNTNSASSRVEVEELLPYSKVFTKLSFY